MLTESASYTQGQPGQVAYVAPPGPSYPAHSAAYAGSQSTPGKYNQPGQSTPGKYNQPGQSAFSSYPSHYTHQQKQTKEQYPIATSYPLQRMQQQTGDDPFSAAVIFIDFSNKLIYFCPEIHLFIQTFFATECTYLIKVCLKWSQHNIY